MFRSGKTPHDIEWGLSMRRILLLASLMIAALCGAARADTNFAGFRDIVQKVVGEAEQCDVGRLDVLGLGVAENLPNAWGELFLTGIQTEGCNGGNNYGYAISVHELANGASRPVAMEPLGFPWIDSIQAKAIKGVPTIVVVGPDYAPEDGRCCPTLTREIRIWVEADGVKWKSVKTWKRG